MSFTTTSSTNDLVWNDFLNFNVFRHFTGSDFIEIHSKPFYEEYKAPMDKTTIVWYIISNEFYDEGRIVKSYANKEDDLNGVFSNFCKDDYESSAINNRKVIIHDEVWYSLAVTLKNGKDDRYDPIGIALGKYFVPGCMYFFKEENIRDVVSNCINNNLTIPSTEEQAQTGELHEIWKQYMNHLPLTESTASSTDIGPRKRKRISSIITEKENRNDVKRSRSSITPSSSTTSSTLSISSIIKEAKKEEVKKCEKCKSIYCDGTWETYKTNKGGKWGKNEIKRQKDQWELKHGVKK
jgi:hypothetical protein